MRSILAAAVAIAVATSPAAARPRGGGDGGGGGGRLGQVSGGIGAATGAGDKRPSGGGPRDQERPHEGELYYREDRGDVTYVYDRDGREVRRIPHVIWPNLETAVFDAFVGLHKVYESEAAISAQLAIEDRWFRLSGGLSHYWETQPDGSQLTMTTPRLMVGVRIDDRGPTKVFLEGGVSIAKTVNDPMADSTITGGIVGAHVQHRLPRGALIVDSHVALYDHDIRAYSARLALRVHHVEAGIRVLDFNVGPALFGPEVGFGF